MKRRIDRLFDILNDHLGSVGFGVGAGSIKYPCLHKHRDPWGPSCIGPSHIGCWIVTHL